MIFLESLNRAGWLLAALFCAALAWGAPAPASAPAIEALLSAHPRVLVFSPHPDDDVLAASGLMRALLALRAKSPRFDLRVVYMTCGDASALALDQAKRSGLAGTYLDLGNMRHAEALKALGLVGAPQDEAIFLGFPDKGLKTLFELFPGATIPYRSAFTLASSVPYAFALHPGEPYLRASVLHDLGEVLGSFKPSLVLTPTVTDENPDHRGTEEFVNAALRKAHFSGLRLEYLIHWEKTDAAWPRHTPQWRTPRSHVPPDYSFPLIADGLTAQEKVRIIEAHRSQTAMEHERYFLVGFAKESEVFWNHRPYADDYLTGD